METVLAVTLIKHIICNKREINPEYGNIFS
jgi:hypothetical protein